MTFSAWRRVHRSASAVVAVMGVAHRYIDVFCI